MSEIIYPQIPHDEKKNVKLNLNDIEAIHHLYHIEKLTIPQLSNMFKVVNSSIRYHLDPEFRQKKLDYSVKYNDSVEGKIIRLQYRKSEHCKKIQRLKQNKYRISSKGRETTRRFKIKQNIKYAMRWF